MKKEKKTANKWYLEVNYVRLLTDFAFPFDHYMWDKNP